MDEIYKRKNNTEKAKIKERAENKEKKDEVFDFEEQGDITKNNTETASKIKKK